MSCVRKRGNKWNVQVRVSGWRSFTKTFNKKYDAIFWSKKLEDKLRSTILPKNDIKKLKLRDFFSRYALEVSSKLKGSEIEIYKLKFFSRLWIGKIPIVNLTKKHFVQFKEDRLKVVKSGTVKSDLMLIKRVFKTAILKWEYGLPINPIDQISLPPSHNSRNRRIEKEELDLLLHHAFLQKNKFILSIIIFAIETGMRRSELLRLKWDNINNGIASLYDTKNGENRDIPLTKDAQKVLNNIDRKSSIYVFPIAVECLKSAWNRIKLKSNINNLRFHDLRHESISRYFEMGLSIAEVSLISGHKDVRQLFRYTHLKADKLKKDYKDIFNL